MALANGLEAVIWDFGGVFTTSPFEAFARFEKERGLPANFLRAINARNPDTNAWALFERAEITADQFDQQFHDESLAQGFGVRGGEVLQLLAGQLRPNVVAAHIAIAQHARTGCITNNVPTGLGAGMARDPDKARDIAQVFKRFDHVLESSLIGIRKPDPRIYALMCEALEVEPRACIYLDDLGINLKPARQMGMITIKVESEAQLLRDLAEATGLNF
jgi:putative hydrolase of the HAD superfamily